MPCTQEYTGSCKYVAHRLVKKKKGKIVALGSCLQLFSEWKCFFRWQQVSFHTDWPGFLYDVVPFNFVRVYTLDIFSLVTTIV